MVMMQRPATLIAFALAAARTAEGARLLREEKQGSSAPRVLAFHQADADANRSSGGGAAGGSGSAVGAAAGAASAAMDAMVMDLIKGRASLRAVVGQARKDIDLDEAERRLAGRLPQDVQSLLGQSTNRSKQAHKGKKEFSEESLAKARTYLNGMVENSMEDLDKVLLECKEFEERNRGTFGQVSNDVKRIAGQISDLRRKQIGANEGIRTQDSMHKQVSGEKQSIATRCHQTFMEKSADLKLKEDDMAVFDFVLAATKCGEGEGDEFLQIAKKHNKSNHASGISICSSQQGEVELVFDNPGTQARFRKLLTPGARKTLSRLLGKVADKRGSFLQLQGEEELADEQKPKPNVTASPTLVPADTTSAAPVREEPAGGQWKKCVNGKPDCGLLYDTMSLEWGAYRDLVDELKYEMGQDKAECTALLANLNEQLAIIAEAKTKAMELLAETISNTQADSQEKTEKTEQYHELEAAYAKKMGECKTTMEEILYTNICAVRKVRDSLMKESEVSPPELIEDCDVEDWTPGDCSMDCDDTCPQDDPYKCGGWQTLERKVTVKPNEFGIQCPALTMQKKCNQFKCFVDCAMSEWSGWSGCSAECEGGEQQRTRSIMVKPAHGGQECDTTVEARTCNTGSCDRDCTLNEWGSWSPCTMACGGGLQERVRTVLVPIRALGKCPEPSHPDRLETKECNTQECAGDEVCIAKQDLIIAIDGSGSLRESGFDVLRDFVANLTGRYESMYYGTEAVKVGVVLFGNGQVAEDGTISKAEVVAPLASTIPALKEKVEALTWERGITNMAQAFAEADRMLREGGRSDAQSAVMVVTDGKPSFKFVTGQQVDKLKAKGTQLFFATIADFPSKDFDILKEWASQPWETNYERIPGLLALGNNFDMFSQRLVSKFCPNSISPSQFKDRVKLQGYMMIHRGGLPDQACGVYYKLGEYGSVDDCAMATREQGFTAFSYSHSGRFGGACFAEEMQVTQEVWDGWLDNMSSPECPGGAWSFDPYSDTFAFDPESMAGYEDWDE